MNTSNTQQPPRDKAVYEAPEVRTYGDIRRVTLTLGLGVRNDSAVPMTGKDKSL